MSEVALGMMSEKLKPCPFCGSNDVEIVESFDGLCVLCGNCEATSNDFGKIEDAIKAWNRRATDEKSPR